MIITYPPVHAVFGVSPHGILAAAGIAVGAMLLFRETRRRGLDSALLERALMWAVPAGIVGARLDYVISHPHEFGSFAQMIAVWQGGLALFGGLLGGLGVGLVVAHQRGIHIFRLLDACAPSLALAIAIGRVGDLLLLDHLGRPTSSSWALSYRVPVDAQLAPGFGPSPAIRPPTGTSCADLGRFYAGCTYHLSAGYDLIGTLLLFVLLAVVRRKLSLRAGTAFSVWAVWYGAQRLALDYTRGIDERPVAGLTGTQLLALAVIVAGGSSLLVIGARRRGWGERPTDPPSRQASLTRESQQAQQTDAETPVP